MNILAMTLLGLILGSFFNVCILRFISGESIVAPPSHCPKCNHQLAWYDLIPVMSYLLLRGKCRYCSTSISIQYPLVELITAATFSLLAWRYGLGIELAVLMAFSTLLIILSGIDARTFRLPDVMTLPGILLAIPSGAILLHHGWIEAIGGAISGFGIFWAVSIWFEKVRHKNGLGLGDVKLMAMIGALVGLSGVPVVMLMAACLGLSFAFVFGRGRPVRLLAFGPWLSAAAILQFILQIQLIQPFNF